MPNSLLVRLLLLLIVSLTAAGTALAQTYTEVGDAGQTTSTASGTGVPGTTLTAITGNISPTYQDVDLYALKITNTSTFSASVTSNAGIDNSLFLFDSAGHPVIANDDQNSMTFNAMIPAGNSLLSSLSPGQFFLGICLSQVEPVNSASQLLFTTDQPTTNVRGAAGGLNPTTLYNFSVSPNTFQETGDYTITLTSAQAAVPEPSSLFLAGVGAVIGLGYFWRRRYRPVV